MKNDEATGPIYQNEAPQVEARPRVANRHMRRFEAAYPTPKKGEAPKPRRTHEKPPLDAPFKNGSRNRAAWRP